MTTYTFYVDKESDEICTATNMDKNKTYQKIQLTSDDNCFLTGNLFSGCFNDPCDDGSYWQEWACNAKDKDDNDYQIFWRFFVDADDVPMDADDLPWDDESCINEIVKE